MRVTTHPRISAPAVTLAAVAALTSCSGSSPAPTASHSSSAGSPAAASPSSSTAGQQALAAYAAMWSDVQALDQTSDYTNPRLGAHLDGQAYMTISENMAADKAKGIIGLGAPVLHPHVLSATATTVKLADCLDDTHWLSYYAATHKLSDEVPGGHRYVAATVTDENGTWKVTTLDVRGEGTCT